MRVREIDLREFPRLNRYIRHELPQVAEDPRYQEAMRLASGMTPPEFRDALASDKPPILRIAMNLEGEVPCESRWVCLPNPTCVGSGGMYVLHPRVRENVVVNNEIWILRCLCEEFERVMGEVVSGDECRPLHYDGCVDMSPVGAPMNYRPRVEVVILHEIAHWAEWTKHGVRRGEAGTCFEKKVYGYSNTVSSRLGDKPPCQIVISPSD